MHSSFCSSARQQSFKVLCAPMCMLFSVLCLAGWPVSSEAARFRCGPDLISDLIFVCGDRGIYLGKGTWSGYGGRPRVKGIADECCRPDGCELQHLEMYCNKPKSQQHTTAYPTTATVSPTTALQHMAQQFEAAFQKKLMEHLGAPSIPKRDAHRKKTQPSLQRKNKMLPSRKKFSTQNTTGRPTSAFRSRLMRRFQS